MTGVEDASTHVSKPQSTKRRRQRPQRRCDVCGNEFAKAEHLARHIRSHTKERPFSCAICGKTYPRKFVAKLGCIRLISD